SRAPCAIGGDEQDRARCTRLRVRYIHLGRVIAGGRDVFMEIAFVRTQGQADRMYVRRTDGTEVSWSFPTFGNYIPHDLVHLVVESAFGLKNGFWGRVDAGVDVARINAEANRIGGANKYAKYGPDQADLFVAEMLAATRWGDSTLSDSDLLAGILRSYSKL